jgi:hypothetical protein
VYCPAPDGVSQINTLGTVWLSSSGPLRSPRLPEKSERLSVGAIFHLENGWRFFYRSVSPRALTLGEEDLKTTRIVKICDPNLIYAARPRINLAWEDVTLNILPPQ